MGLSEMKVAIREVCLFFRFSKAINSAEPQSIQRYNMRLQALERCYKMILGKGGGVVGKLYGPCIKWELASWKIGMVMLVQECSGAVSRQFL